MVAQVYHWTHRRISCLCILPSAWPLAWYWPPSLVHSPPRTRHRRRRAWTRPASWPADSSIKRAGGVFHAMASRAKEHPRGPPWLRDHGCWVTAASLGCFTSRVMRGGEPAAGMATLGRCAVRPRSILPRCGGWRRTSSRSAGRSSGRS